MLESIGRFDAVVEQREHQKKFLHIKECMLQLVYMDISKPAQKMIEQAKQLGYLLLALNN